MGKCGIANTTNENKHKQRTANPTQPNTKSKTGLVLGKNKYVWTTNTCNKTSTRKRKKHGGVTRENSSRKQTHQGNYEYNYGMHSYAPH